MWPVVGGLKTCGICSENLKKMVEKCAIKCSEDLCLPEEERVKFTSQNFPFTIDDSVQLWNHFKPLISEYKGDAEKWYAVFYGLLCDNLLPTKFEDLPDTNISLPEVGACMLLHLSGEPSVKILYFLRKNYLPCNICLVM